MLNNSDFLLINHKTGTLHTKVTIIFHSNLTITVL